MQLVMVGRALGMFESLRMVTTVWPEVEEKVEVEEVVRAWGRECGSLETLILKGSPSLRML